MYPSKQVLVLCVFILAFSVSNGAVKLHSGFKVKAVNIGGWLVTEGWIKPSLFAHIPNKDLLDGTVIVLKAVKLNQNLSAESGGSIVVSDRTLVSESEKFRLWRINATFFNFRVYANSRFVGLRGVDVVAVSNATGRSETFEIVRKSNDSNRVRIKASNGFFVQAKTEESLTADFGGDSDWRDNDPSVFEFTVAAKLDGEYQVTNGHGPELAPGVMREHWKTWTVEEDFKFISENGLNTVRIPVGWWIASDPTPPRPYVGGSLEALDNAFKWAEKYELKVIVDLHDAPGSQNGWTSRDGSLEWGKTEASIHRTVSVIDFLAARYSKSPSLYAVELLNEPLAPGVSVDSLIKYYQLGYSTVRRHSKTVYVILSNRLGPANPKEFFQLAGGLKGSVIDLHFYNLFWDGFVNMTIRENIDYIRTNRSTQLGFVTVSNGWPLTFLGEWVAEWLVPNATKADYQNFARAQLEVYEEASFGWAYWDFKNVNNHWSLYIYILLSLSLSLYIYIYYITPLVLQMHVCRSENSKIVTLVTFSFLIKIRFTS